MLMFIILYNTDLFASSSNQNFCAKCKKLLCTWKPVSCLSETAYKKEKRSNITRHTRLLLVTANEQSTAPGSKWGLTLKPGIDCLNHYIFRLFGRLGRYGGLYKNHTFKCKIRNFLNRHFESFASYATATVTKENGNHL